MHPEALGLALLSIDLGPRSCGISVDRIVGFERCGTSDTSSKMCFPQSHGIRSSTFLDHIIDVDLTEAFLFSELFHRSNDGCNLLVRKLA